MKQNDIRVGRTYANRRRGKTRRTVVSLVPDSTDSGWYVRYSSEDGGGFVRLGVFSAWAGAELRGAREGGE